MKLNIKYFGMIAETTSVAEEIREIEGGTVTSMRQELESIYPNLEQLTYRIAVNGKIAEETSAIATGDEIALLPPFAGG